MIAGEISDFADFKGYIKANPDSDAAEMIRSAPLKRKAFKALEDDEENTDESDRGSIDGDGEVNGGDDGGDGGDGGDGDGDGGGDGGMDEEEAT